MTAVEVFIVLFGFLSHGSSWMLEEDCGEIQGVEGRILNGVDAKILHNPWMALIKTPTEFLCGGTLITRRFVLTAAHCECSNKDCTKKHTDITARLAEYDRSTLVDFGLTYEDFPVEKVYAHKGFVMRNHQNDIALLKLKGIVEYKRQIQPICIPLESRKKSGMAKIMKFTAIGWGKTQSGTNSDVLQTVEINRIPNEDCENIIWEGLVDSQICGGTGTKKDTCTGDSGGPISSSVYYMGKWRETQIGITSFGPSQCGGAAVYSDLMYFSDFIEQTVMESDITVVLPKLQFLDAGCLATEASTGGKSFPWLAHVYMDAFLITYGTLISDRFVLTTAQFLPENAPLEVRLGKFSGSYEVTHKVKTLHKHPDFVRLAQNDIALIELKSVVKYNNLIRPICMPSLTDNKEQQMFQKKADQADRLRVVGWGRWASTMVYRANSSECYQQDHQEIGDKQICVDHPYDLNLGSGSPLVRSFKHGGSEGFTLVGLASFGRHGPRPQDVYTNVLSYLDWIRPLVKQ
ncbi:polyserase-2 isoform X2 [Drosophila rhopaloa]|nr:polyserase-2 isoform X2 [Drosophila rhopaloa]